MIESTTNGIGECFRLLVDFLEHEMIVAALFSSVSVHAELRNFAGDWDIVKISNVHRIRSDDRDVIVIQIDYSLSMGEDGACVRSDDALTITHADDDRAATAGGDNPIRFLS